MLHNTDKILIRNDKYERSPRLASARSLLYMSGRLFVCSFVRFFVCLFVCSFVEEGWGAQTKTCQA